MITRRHFFGVTAAAAAAAAGLPGLPEISATGANARTKLWVHHGRLWAVELSSATTSCIRRARKTTSGLSSRGRPGSRIASFIPAPMAFRIRTGTIASTLTYSHCRSGRSRTSSSVWRGPSTLCGGGLGCRPSSKAT